MLERLTRGSARRAEDRRARSAAYRQFRRSRSAQRRAGCRPRLRAPRRAPAVGCGADRAARLEIDDRRPPRSQGARAGIAILRLMCAAAGASSAFAAATRCSGRKVCDPHRYGGTGDGDAGLGLLDVETEMAPEKTVRNSTARSTEYDAPLLGYEIHLGITTGSRLRPALRHHRRPRRRRDLAATAVSWAPTCTGFSPATPTARSCFRSFG